jgi:hypothetical protein
MDGECEGERDPKNRYNLLHASRVCVNVALKKISSSIFFYVFSLRMVNGRNVVDGVEVSGKWKKEKSGLFMMFELSAEYLSITLNLSHSLTHFLVSVP